MKPFLIVNPRAANGTTGRHFDDISAAVRAAVGEHGHAFTERPMHASELARRALREGADLVIAVGGDGTINEVVNGFFEAPGHGDPPRPVRRLPLCECCRNRDPARRARPALMEEARVAGPKCLEHAVRCLLELFRCQHYLPVLDHVEAIPVVALVEDHVLDEETEFFPRAQGLLGEAVLLELRERFVSAQREVIRALA